MRKTDFQRFESATRKWLSVFGLTDWTVQIDEPKEPSEDGRTASISFNTANRKACISWYGGRAVDHRKLLVNVPPEDHALHEVIHLLLGDLTATVGQKGDNHEDAFREEHKVIERLVGAFNAVR